MNIIFLDFDGVINTKHFTTKDEIEFNNRSRSSKLRVIERIEG